MLENLGTVKFNERILNDRLQRFVDEQMRQWLRDNRLENSPAGYEVSFFDEDVLDEVSCLIVIQSGQKSWRSWETAPNGRMAFTLSLERLHLDTQLGNEPLEESADGQRGSTDQRSTATEQAGPIH